MGIEFFFSIFLKKIVNMPFVTINRNPECKLYYEMVGKDEAPIKILFVMGLNTSFRGWKKQIDYFSQHEHAQCCSFDNRGVHRSSAPPGPYTTQLMATDALLLADDIGWSKFHLVGVSMGGMISQHIAIQAPERIISLTLIATRAVGGLLASRPTFTGLKHFVKLRTEKDLEKRLPKAMNLLFPADYLDAENEEHAPKTNKDVIAEEFLEMLKKEPATTDQGRDAQTQAAINHHLTNEEIKKLKSSSFPKLILHGTDDMLVRYVHGEDLKNKIGGEFISFDGVGHGINLQKAKQVNQAIHKHIQNAQRGLNKDLKIDSDENDDADDDIKVETKKEDIETETETKEKVEEALKEVPLME